MGHYLATWESVASCSSKIGSLFQPVAQYQSQLPVVWWFPGQFIPSPYIFHIPIYSWRGLPNIGSRLFQRARPFLMWKNIHIQADHSNHWYQDHPSKMMFDLRLKLVFSSLLQRLQWLCRELVKQTWNMDIWSLAEYRGTQIACFKDP